MKRWQWCVVAVFAGLVALEAVIYAQPAPNNCGVNMLCRVRALIGGTGSFSGDVTSGGTFSGGFDGGMGRFSGVYISGTLGLRGLATFAAGADIFEVDAGTLIVGGASTLNTFTASSGYVYDTTVGGSFSTDAGGGSGLSLNGSDSICTSEACAQAFYYGAGWWTFSGAGVEVTTLAPLNYVVNTNTSATCSNNAGAVCIDDNSGLAIAAGDGGTFATITTNAANADAGTVQLTRDSLLLPLIQGSRTCSSINNQEIVSAHVADFAAPSAWFCDGIYGLWRPLFFSEAIGWRTPDDTVSVVNGFELTASFPLGVEGHVVSCEGTVWTAGTCTGGCAPPTNAVLHVHQNLSDGGQRTLCQLEISCTAAAQTHHLALCSGYFVPYGVDGGLELAMTYNPQSDGGTCTKLPVANGRCRASAGRASLP